MTKRERVVVAMSGGVDSAVAAGLLAREGYDVKSEVGSRKSEVGLPLPQALPAAVERGEGRQA